MSKYLLFLILLFSFTGKAQQPVVVKTPGLKNSDNQNPANARLIVFDEQEPFVNGYARVLQNNKFTFINKTGNIIAPFEYDGARNFSNRLAAVNKNDKWGFINESGKVIIPIAYEIVFDFTESVTAAFVKKKWWLITAKGDLLKPLDITVFNGFKNGIAKISKDGRAGTMNTKGEIVFGKEQESNTQNNLIAAKKNNNQANTAITVCPDNIDFEYGSFFNWKCFLGQVDSVGNTNVITVNPSAPTNNRHTLYSRVLPSPIDAYGLFPINPPDGSNFALRLGNTRIGAQAERVRYSIHVPVNDSNFSIKYDYAVVFEDPGHTIWTQPRFTVKVFDSAANAYVDCASFEYISVSNLPGFARSTVDTGVIYKPWSSVFLSLRGYAGKTMYLEFTTADCVRRGHWGYAYVDVEKPCGKAVEMDYDCSAPNITTLTGPPGFQTYNWWNQTFGTLLGTGQQIVLNPGPTVNSIIWLEMIPFYNFGCTDTIPVKITGIFNANFSLSDTTATCAPHTFTFYNRDLPSTSAIWDFGDGTTGTGDTVTHTYNLPGNYIVKLNVVLQSGCMGEGLKLVSVLQPAGSFSFDASSSCSDQIVRFDAVVVSGDSLFFDFGDGNYLRTLLTTVYHTYNTPGVFVPKLKIQSVNGCQSQLPVTDTLMIEKLNPGFYNTELKICGSTTLNFTDTSYSYFGITSRQWDFGDGTSGSGTNVRHTYTNPGNYTVRLIIAGTSGCLDTISKPITVAINNVPVAAISGDTVQCLFVPVTFTGSVQSTDAVNYQNWVLSTGLSGSGNTLTTFFSQPGIYTVKFIAGTVNGCYDTAIHQIKINPAPDVLQPSSQVLCNGYTTLPINFSGGITGTTYTWTNTAPSIGLPASGTGNIPSFTANSNGAIAVATITVTPMANGCPGSVKRFTITINPTPYVAQPVSQLLCNGAITNVVSFTGANAGATYKWANNNTSIGLAAAGTGDINSFIAVNKTAVPVTATITVTPETTDCPGMPKIFTIIINPTPNVVAGNNANVCLGNTAQLSASGATQYSWSPAANLSCTNCSNPAAKPVDSVMYTVKGVNTFGCFDFDSVLLSVIKPFTMQVSPGDTLCMGESISLKAFSASRYLWSPPTDLNRVDIAEPTARPNVNRTYRVIGFDGYNCFTDTGYVTIIVGPRPTVNIGPDRTLATGTPLTLNAVTQNGPIVSWLWTPSADLSCNNCPSPKTTVTNNSFYSVIVTNTFGCTATDTIFINSFCKSAQVFIPNAFTPDGDGLNDVLMVRGSGITVKSFRIFNRWGELVFEKENFYPNDLKYGWDGRVRGVPATPDVFVYTAEIFCDNGAVYTYKGNTTILK